MSATFEQLPFTFGPERIVGVSSKLPIAKRWDEFVRLNPHAIDAIVHVARQLRSAGQKRVGMKQVFEVVRFTYAIQTRDDSGFKLNNSYTALAARHVAQIAPDLADAFEFRTRRAA